MESKQYRIKLIFDEKINDRKWEMKYRLREEVSDSDVINTLVYKYLEEVTERDLLDYWEKVLKKDVNTAIKKK